MIKKLILSICCIGITTTAVAGPRLDVFSNLFHGFSYCLSTSTTNSTNFKNYVDDDIKTKQHIPVENKTIVDLLSLEMVSDGKKVVAYNGDSKIDGNNTWTEREKTWNQLVLHSNTDIMKLSETSGKMPTIANYHKAARYFFNSLGLGSPIMNKFLDAYPNKKFENMKVTPENLQQLTKAENEWIMLHKNEISTYGDMLAYVVPQETIDARLVAAIFVAKATFYYQGYGLTMDEEYEKYIHEIIPRETCPF